MAKRGNLDRLSSLPDDILSHILIFIPMKDAVQTSVLSTRWRYLFASMSFLDFDEIFMYTDNVRSLKKFVYRLLHSSNQGSLECFRATRVPRAYHDCLSHWVSFALRRGVKEIDLLFHRLRHVDEIVTPMFTCQSLVTLKLHHLRGEIMFPSTVCLPNLKSFEFGHLILTNDSIPRLISSCSVLEDLVLYVCKFDNTSEINIQSLSLKTLVLNFNRMKVPDFYYVMVINAPSLVHFEYNGYIADAFTTSNMTSLIKASIRILSYGFGDVDRERSIIRFLHGICNVRSLRSLHLTINDAGGMLYPTTRIDQGLAFHNIVELDFFYCRDCWKGTWVVEFLHCLPNLKTLILDLAAVLRIFMRPPEEVPSCLSSHLKEITIKGLTSSELWGEQRTFEFISYFLDNAMVLEKLRLGVGTRALFDSSLHKQLKVFEKLLSLPRSSSTCQVLFF